MRFHCIYIYIYNSKIKKTIIITFDVQQFVLKPRHLCSLSMCLKCIIKKYRTSLVSYDRIMILSLLIFITSRSCKRNKVLISEYLGIMYISILA